MTPKRPLRKQRPSRGTWQGRALSEFCRLLDPGPGRLWPILLVARAHPMLKRAGRSSATRVSDTSRKELAKACECFKYSVFQDFKTKCTRAFNEIMLMQDLQPRSCTPQTALHTHQTPLVFLQWIHDWFRERQEQLNES